MRFYPHQHPCYGGLDWQARSRSVCLVSYAGEVLVHRTMPAAPAPCLKVLAPYRGHLVVAVECLLPWSWRAALCALEGMPCVLGHALSRKAIHGGKAQHDTRDAHKLAALWRGRMLPQASGSPAEMRATRDL
jgi:hypothetical protein